MMTHMELITPPTATPNNKYKEVVFQNCADLLIE